MEIEPTTIAIQRYLDELAAVRRDSSVEPVVRDLLERAVRRLQLLCAHYLYRKYPRLTRAPLNLEVDEMLGAVVERLIKAMRSARPTNVRQFFALANQHMRWELNDLARRLDQQVLSIDVHDDAVAAPMSSDSGLSSTAWRVLQAIECLPPAEREIFSLVRIQGMNPSEVAEVVGISAKTVQRRLNRALLFLSEQLDDLRPPLAP